MRNRINILLVVVLAMIAAALGSVVSEVATAGPADACSVVAPGVGAFPATELSPGEIVRVHGWGLYDVTFNDAPPPEHVIGPDGLMVVTPPPPCDFELIPQKDIPIIWVGNVTERLAIVSGPEFQVGITVPADAQPGRARMEIAGLIIEVHVADNPEPCPLYFEGGVSGVRADCPPPPCPDPLHKVTQEEVCPPCPLFAHEGDFSGDLLPWCPPPEPCPVFVSQDGNLHDVLPWCPPPEPCPVYADGPTGDILPWCPPPEPCPVFASQDGNLDEILPWCPPPEPCVAYLADAPLSCPEPCPTFVERDTSDQPLWCPPPEPCPTHAERGAADARPWCPPPEPCPEYSNGHAQDAPPWCPPPEPCPVFMDNGGMDAHAGDVLVWCPPPEPCPLFALEDGNLDEILGWCPPPEPCPVYLYSEEANAASRPWCPPPEPCGVPLDSLVLTCPHPCFLEYDEPLAHTWCSPEPCEPLWCPPGPCPVHPTADAKMCPEPCGVDGLFDPAIGCPDPCRPLCEPQVVPEPEVVPLPETSLPETSLQVLPVTQAAPEAPAAPREVSLEASPAVVELTAAEEAQIEAVISYIRAHIQLRFRLSIHPIFG